jgi:hypothetical protein
MPSLDSILKLGPTWGPLLLALLAVSAIIRHVKKGDKDGWSVLTNASVLLVVFGCTVALGGWYYYRYRYLGLPKSFKDGEIGILIAEVPGDSGQQRQAAYARAIHETLQGEPKLSEVAKVRLLERPLPADPERQHLAALKLGRWLHAAFVLRPSTVEGV